MIFSRDCPIELKEVRLTVEEIEMIEKLRRKDGRTISEVVRDAVREYYFRHL